MPLYEFYCESCDKVFDAVRPIARSSDGTACPTCGKEAPRIMPTTFATMSRTRGVKERVPFHHHSVREEQPKRAIALVKPKEKPTAKRSTKAATKKK